ncbi:hypothetical protein [Amycolatopsis sp. GM8]|uniref:hypothetical protein n=1 Tax=Amycolatopsis sp. GM8 TaxID=2896530 RepID=UPI001F1BA66F|nr:hypothetical protein [Amycolatopsis sp. GM8]
MSDRADYYKKLRTRASNLRTELDDGIQAFMTVDRRVDEIGKADFDEPGELSTTDYDDLKTCVEKVLFYARMAEKASNDHISELDRELRNLGLEPLSGNA